MLTSDLSYCNLGDVFTIKLSKQYEDLSYTITSGSQYVVDISGFIPNKGRFTWGPNDISFTTISFKVNTDVKSKLFTLKLEGFNSSVTVVLNDYVKPFMYVQHPSVDRGQTALFTLVAPRSWNGQKHYYDTDPVTNSGTGIPNFFMIQDGSSTIEFNTMQNLLYSVPNEKINIVLSEPQYRDISASVVIIGSTPPIYYWRITDVSNNVISQINDGGSFIVTLITSGVTVNTQIRYTITGVDLADYVDDLETDSLTGVFTVPHHMSTTITMKNNLTTVLAPKKMYFTTNFNEESLLDITCGINIINTSQSPNYILARTVSEPIQGQPFNIIFYIDNYTFLTDTQKAEQLAFSFDDVNADQYIESNGYRDLSGIIVVSSGFYNQRTLTMSHTFPYTYKNTASNKTMRFLLGGKYMDISFNVV